MGILPMRAMGILPVAYSVCRAKMALRLTRTGATVQRLFLAAC